MNQEQINTRPERLIHSLPALDLSDAILNNTDKKQYDIKNDILTTITSAFYGKILVILGIALPITDSIASEDYESYDGFYLYLYTGSIIFLSYIYVNHIRQKSKKKHRTGLLTRETTFGEENVRDTRKNKNIRYGSFYFRMGVTGFGIGSVIYSGLQFGQYFELSSEKDCANLLKAFIPLFRVTFTLMQMLFIFSYSNIVRMQKPFIARYGIMHMIATNLCEWLYVLVQETQLDILRSVNVKETRGTLYELDDQFIKSKAFQITKQFYNRTRECLASEIMESIIKKSEPYLAPCSVEYSFLSAVMLALMWKNACNNSFEKEPFSLDNAEVKQQKCDVMYSRRQSQFSVDCAQAHKGLFSGILVLTMTIISLIMFFELVSYKKYKDIAILQVNVWETFLFVSGTVATIFCITTLRDVGFRTVKNNLELEHLLLLVTQCGVFLYFLFQIIGGTLMGANKGKGGIMRIIAPCCALLQSSCQTVLILDARQRRCITLQQMKRKPGRQLITFLLVTNISLWIVNRVKNNRAFSHPNQMDFYGILPWNIITHVAMPLLVSYRFQATLCFYEVWKRIYKTRSFNNSFLEYV